MTAVQIVRARLKDTAVGRSNIMRTLTTIYGGHQAVWNLLGHGPDKPRDFVYRLDMSPIPQIYAVLPRVPPDSDVWAVAAKPYDVAIEAGDVLRFSLRANATTRRAAQGAKGARQDVVIDAIHKARASRSPIDRRAITHEAGLAWLARKGNEHGFSLFEAEFRVDAHNVETFEKASGGSPLRISSMDFTGLLRVENAPAFKDALRTGIGPAKGFGMGLLLVRRP